MNDAPLAPGTDAAAAAASTAAASPSLRLLPLCPGGEGDGDGEGLENLTDRGVAVGNRWRPHLPSSPLCCSQSASRRPESEAG